MKIFLAETISYIDRKSQELLDGKDFHDLSFSQDIINNNSFSARSSVAVLRSTTKDCKDPSLPEPTLGEGSNGATAEEPGNSPLPVLSFGNIAGIVGFCERMGILSL